MFPYRAGLNIILQRLNKSHHEEAPGDGGKEKTLPLRDRNLDQNPAHVGRPSVAISWV